MFNCLNNIMSGINSGFAEIRKLREQETLEKSLRWYIISAGNLSFTSSTLVMGNSDRPFRDHQYVTAQRLTENDAERKATLLQVIEYSEKAHEQRYPLNGEMIRNFIKDGDTKSLEEYQDAKKADYAQSVNPLIEMYSSIKGPSGKDLDFSGKIFFAGYWPGDIIDSKVLGERLEPRRIDGKKQPSIADYLKSMQLAN